MKTEVLINKMLAHKLPELYTESHKKLSAVHT